MTEEEIARRLREKEGKKDRNDRDYRKLVNRKHGEKSDVEISRKEAIQLDHGRRK